MNYGKWDGRIVGFVRWVHRTERELYNYNIHTPISSQERWSDKYGVFKEHLQCYNEMRNAYLLAYGFFVVLFLFISKVNDLSVHGFMFVVSLNFEMLNRIY